MSINKQRVALMLGDPAGIGAEICAKLAADLVQKNDSSIQIVMIGDQRVWERAKEICALDLKLPVVHDQAALKSSSDPMLFYDCPVDCLEKIVTGRVSKEAGQSVYQTLKYILKEIRQGFFQGFVFAPLNKESMRLSGCPYSSELEMFKATFNRPLINGEINVLDQFMTTRVTSHIALKEVVPAITKESVYRTIKFLNTELSLFSGTGTPGRIAVSALNPHGGEGGLFGDEEIRSIQPAVEQARQEGIDVYGPFPADTIFLRVQKGEFDAVISMYHDQGQVATKLIGFDRGVTLHGGMPVPIATCAHGTAFDIAGSGRASHNALLQAYHVVLRMIINKQQT